MAILKATTIEGNLTTTGTINSIKIGKSSSSLSLYITPSSSSAPSLGTYATAIGYSASAAGYGSLSIGYGANAVESYAIAIGRLTISEGTYATAIGYGSNATNTSGIAIGYNSKASYGVTIGSGTNRTGTGQYLSLGVAGAEWAHKTSASTGWNNGSDRRDKIDFQRIDKELSVEFIKKLAPTSYKLNSRSNYDEEIIGDSGEILKQFNEVEYLAGTKKGKRIHAGFIAQEVEAAVNEVLGSTQNTGVVSKNTVDDPLAIRERYTLIYDEFIPYLVGAVQSLTEKIEILEEEIKKLKGE